MEKIKVLYIDDEVSNLNAFKASFRRQFNIHTATSADEGYEILKTNPIEVVISDQRMPGKSGVDFFESIRDLHPNPIRILLTAYSDIDAVIDAINRGGAYRYVSKPWNDYDLKLAIENAYHLYHLKEQNNKLNIKYRKVFSDSSDPIILFDTKGRIVDYNKAAVNFIGTKKNPIHLLTINDIIKNDAQQIVDKLKTKGIISGIECQIYGKQNEIKLCLLSANKITNSYGEVISYQAIIKDITERSKMNQLLLKKTIETQEQERERISRDLHDGVGQSLAAIKLHFESFKANHNQNNEIEDELETISTILQDTIQDLRRICFNTLPIVLQEYGLIKGIQELQINASNKDFKILFSYNDEFPAMSKPLQISIFRIIQEFINNSIKHGESTEVIIDLENNSEYIILNLKDNGVGFNINDLELFKGHGLKNIQNRIDSFKGKIEMNSVIDRGTEFDIAFPIHLN
ncbi:MAG: response regulator [Flavobacteriales bacterium]|nr:response regulator [Flavobacteriales bacterium]